MMAEDPYTVAQASRAGPGHASKEPGSAQLQAEGASQHAQLEQDSSWDVRGQTVT